MAGTNFTSSGTGNWSDASKWSGGTGSNYPGQDPADTATIGAHTITLDGNYTLASVTGNNASSILSVGATRTLTLSGSLTYTSTSTSGFVQVGTSGNLTVHGKSVGTSSGYTICTSGTNPALTLSQTTGDQVVIDQQGTGRVVQLGTTGTYAITGIATCSSANSGKAVYGSGTLTWNAGSNGVCIDTGSFNDTASALVQCTGTWTITGDIKSASGMIAVVTTGAGSLTWTGNHTITAGTECYVWNQAGTLVLGTVGSNLVITNNGVFIIRKNATTTATYFTITQNSSSAQQAGTGWSMSVTGPTLPAANKVKTGEANFGYAGDLQTPSYTAPSGKSGGMLEGGF